MKKLIGLMVALILALSVCACGGQPAAEQKGESETAVKTESKEENKEDSTSSSAENSESSLDTESGRDVPDYSQEDCWLSFPEITKDVDTFYIYSTVYMGEGKDDPNFARLDNSEMILGAEGEYATNASFFISPSGFIIDLIKHIK